MLKNVHSACHQKQMIGLSVLQNTSVHWNLNSLTINTPIPTILQLFLNSMSSFYQLQLINTSLKYTIKKFLPECIINMPIQLRSDSMSDCRNPKLGDPTNSSQKFEV